MQLTQILGLLIFAGYKIVQTRAEFNECQIANNCRECIILNPKCAWCNVLEYRERKTGFRYKKCDTLNNHEDQGCSAIHNPRSSSNITKKAKLGGDIRVSPQAVTVKLRPGETSNVKITIKTPKNFPIDLYYLMDLSVSMKDDLKQVEKLGGLLSKELKSLTTNFRLGFGGYVDKPIDPYTTTFPKEITAKINDIGDNAVYTFGYKNYLPLNDDTTEFTKSVKSVNISFNRDGPEGSLDALMQVVVCRDAIGWRDKKYARRIIIITTDQTFHYSGDGLLAGVVVPNKALCLLKDNKEYTGWNTYDYPSLSQMRALMIDNQIVPIFASLGNDNLYAEVAKFFGQKSGAVARRLAKDSSNVVPLIREAYEKIAKKVGITSTAPDDVSVTFHTTCGEKGQDLIERSTCNNVSIGQEVVFEARLTAKECKMGVEKKRTFKLKTDFDDIDVTLEMICNCPCEDTKIANSPECHGNGTLSCGLCLCDTGYGGSACSCTAKEAKDEALCKKSGEEAVCSNAGVCNCGECICNKITEDVETKVWSYTYGGQCECNNATCGRSNRAQICGGPDRGTCDCGKCRCNKNWTGATCQESCIQSDEACIGKNGVICGGKGTCLCNRCVCDEGHVGVQCQECVERCPDPCEDYKECVKCLEFDTSELSPEECIVECEKYNISTTEFEVVERIDEKKRRCIARDEDDCSFVYTYHTRNDTDQVFLVIQEGLICPAEPDIVAIILGVIAGIVGIGLALLLIWKLLATIQDRRDFAMFEKDRQNPKWDSGENPIYKEATSTFQNPMFKKTVPTS